MKRIFRHIEYLLLEHDHVIIPQLGGFVANDMPSVWSEEEELFLPPYRTVHFNASLNHGDNTLVDSLAQAYSVPPAEAEKWCAQFVQNIHMELAENGSLDFGSIGVMMQEGPEQAITFSPCKAGVTTPDFYGLDAFHMPLLEDTYQQKEKSAFMAHIHRPAAKDKNTNNDGAYTLRINRHLAHTVATLAASIILFVLFTPVLNKPMAMSPQQAKAELFVPTHLLYSAATPAAPAPIVMVKEEPNVCTAQPSSTSNKLETEAQKPQKNNAIAPTTVASINTAKHQSMAIVLASAISVQNAEAYAKKLQSKGHDAHVYRKGKMVRVIVPCYDGEQAARQQMQQMKANCPEFKQAWLTSLE